MQAEACTISSARAQAQHLQRRLELLGLSGWLNKVLRRLEGRLLPQRLQLAAVKLRR